MEWLKVVEYNLSGTTLRRSEVEKNSDGTVPASDYQIFAENVTGLTFTLLPVETAEPGRLPA